MPARRAIRRRRRLAGLVVAVAGAAALGDQVLATSPSTDPSPAREHRPLRSEHRVAPDAPPMALGEADGAVPDGTTVFDDRVPGVANLAPALLAALRRAASDAADEGVALLVDSGWRSPAYQRHLLDEAVVKHGSRDEAARWVALPERSVHVSGDAVDVGPSAAAAWLSERGSEYGLCQIYANEPWHYELRPQARAQGCPPMYADPTHDPRMQP